MFFKQRWLSSYGFRQKKKDQKGPTTKIIILFSFVCPVCVQFFPLKLFEIFFWKFSIDFVIPFTVSEIWAYQKGPMAKILILFYLESYFKSLKI